MTSNQIQQQLQEMLRKSYSPYSGVKVAAAVEFEVAGKKQLAFGVNVENVSYGLTVCAERSAISTAIGLGMTSITRLFVMSNQDQPISPCGACRQVVTEFMANEDGQVLCLNHDGDKEWQSTLGQLLPKRFDL